MHRYCSASHAAAGADPFAAKSRAQPTLAVLAASAILDEREGSAEGRLEWQGSCRIYSPEDPRGHTPKRAPALAAEGSC